MKTNPTIEALVDEFDKEFSLHENHCTLRLEEKYSGPECSCNIAEFKQFLLTALLAIREATKLEDVEIAEKKQ